MNPISGKNDENYYFDPTQIRPINKDPPVPVLPAQEPKKSFKQIVKEKEAAEQARLRKERERQEQDAKNKKKKEQK